MQTIIFSLLIFETIIILITWLWKRKQFRYGELYDTRDVLGLYMIPRIVIAQSIILLIFFILELNKLHLLYIFPIVYFYIAFRQAKRIEKDDAGDPRLSAQNRVKKLMKN